MANQTKRHYVRLQQLLDSVHFLLTSAASKFCNKTFTPQQARQCILLTVFRTI